MQKKSLLTAFVFLGLVATQSYALNYLYAPWRSVHKNNGTAKPKASCIFCEKYEANRDQELFILKRYEYHAVMLNLYPYNPGHLLIVPLEHTAQIEKLSPEALVELIDLIAFCTEITRNFFKADGINVGINMGKAAGASVPDHLHVHIVPRFAGDTNFLPVTADTSVFSFDFVQIFKDLKQYFH